MKKYRRYLPSLDALVFFEAAARLNSFTRAAAELYVTQAAVSKRIRELESQLGVALFHRDGRLLTLTEVGRRLHERTDMALEYLEDACRLAVGEDTEVIHIAANSAVSLLWLAPRLKQFGLSEHSTDVNLFTSDKLSDTLDPDNDLVVVYGYGETSGWTSEQLFPERLIPVAAPEYFQSLGIDTPIDLSSETASMSAITLLDYEQRAPDWINWQIWIDKLKARTFRNCRTRTYRTYAQAIGAALAGKGLALGSRGLIDEELQAGRLCAVGDLELCSDRAYFLAQPRNKRLTRAAEALSQALLSS